LFVIALAGVQSGCGGAPFGGALSGLHPRSICYVYHQNSPTPTTYTGPDSQAVPLTADECGMANAEARANDQRAEQQRQAAAAQDAQQKRAATVIQAEEARGYTRQITVKDLILDARMYAANGTKVVVTGFYKLQGRRDERFYVSFNDLMMHSYSNVGASYVGLLTENGTRPMREYLMRCGSTNGCQVTILGHVSPCVETNAFGTSTGDLCLVAEDMRAPDAMR
jgi:hypothetical protein